MQKLNEDLLDPIWWLPVLCFGKLIKQKVNNMLSAVFWK